MKATDYKTFKNGVIEDLTNNDENIIPFYMLTGYLWLRLTNKQCNDLRDTLRGLHLGIETEDGLKVGNWLLKN